MTNQETGTLQTEYDGCVAAPKCSDCTSPMFEQYKGYPGHWYCFHPTTLRTSKKITICDTPWGEDEYRLLREAETPNFCPYYADNRNGRYEEGVE